MIFRLVKSQVTARLVRPAFFLEEKGRDYGLYMEHHFFFCREILFFSFLLQHIFLQAWIDVLGGYNDVDGYIRGQYASEGEEEKEERRIKKEEKEEKRK